MVLFILIDTDHFEPKFQITIFKILMIKIPAISYWRVTVANMQLGFFVKTTLETAYEDDIKTSNSLKSNCSIANGIIGKYIL